MFSLTRLSNFWFADQLGFGCFDHNKRAYQEQTCVSFSVQPLQDVGGPALGRNLYSTVGANDIALCCGNA